MARFLESKNNIKKPAQKKKKKQQATSTQERINQKSYGTTKPNVKVNTSRSSNTVGNTGGRYQAGSTNNNNNNTQQRYNNRPQGTATRTRNTPATAGGSQYGRAGTNARRSASEGFQRDMQTRQAESRQRNQKLKEDQERRRQESEARRNKTIASRNPRMQDTARSTRLQTEEERRQRQDRLREAQKQKMGDNSMASESVQRAANRAVRNTPTVVKESLKQTAIGHGKTAADLTELNKSAAIGSKIDIKSKEFQEDIEKRRKQSTRAAGKAFDELSKMQEKSEERMQKVTGNAKGLEKAYYGALESGTGMALDRALGPAWAVSMLSRTYGNTRGQARKEGATEAEDRAYSLLQGAKEVATEYLFQGVGLARGLSGRASLAPSEKLAKYVTRNMSGRAADLTHAGIRLLGGTFEENAEEGIGWGVDPIIKEFTYKKNVRSRQAQQMMREQSDSLRSNITSPQEAQAMAAYLGSDDFLEQQTRTYMDSGIGEAEARDLAEQMRDYLDASLSGDTGRMADIEESLTSKLAGKGTKQSLKEEYSLSELMDTVASTTLLTATTGLPGAFTTASKGAAVRDRLGDSGIRALAKTAEDFEDKEMQLKAKAMSDRLASGKDITSTQAYDLAVGVQEQYNKDSDRQQAAYQTANKTIKSERLVTPYTVSRNGDIDMDEVTDKTYQTTAKNAKETIRGYAKSDESTESLTDTEIDRGSRAIAGFQTGVFTVDDANELNFHNTAVRSAFQAETGVDLNQYVVKQKNGEIDIPATNAATKDALFAMAADNLVKSAQAETANWMDNAKGEVVTQISRRMGAKGTEALQVALDDVDERDRTKYMMTANATDMLYQAARNMGTDWESAKKYAQRMFPSISEEKLKAMYDAGLEDRIAATDNAVGLQIEIGKKAEIKAGAEKAPMGQLLIETDVPVKGTVARTFTELAKNLGVDIHLVDHFTDKDGKVLKNVNGEYIDGNIYINVNSDFEKNMGFIFMHEVTHHLKKFAPEQYHELENLVREKWFKYDSAQMQSEIAKKIETYAKHGQTLTEEQALEEIIADAAHEFLTDRNFAREIANEDATLAQAVLTSIRNALRMLRRIMSADGLDETHMNTLFSQLDILDEAERLWLDAYKQAVRNNAAVEVDRLQNQIYEEGKQSATDSKASYSLSNMPSIDELDMTNSTVEDENGDMVAEFQDNGSVRFSISSFEKSGRGIYQDYLNKQVKNGNLSRKEADDMMHELETVYGIAKEFADKTDENGDPIYAPFSAWSYADVVTDEKGKPVFSAIKKNSEYKMNIDFSTICKKRRTLDAVFREMINRGMFEKLDLNKDESAAMVVNINNLIRQHKFEAACALCFVEARRYRQQQTATTFRDMWNSIVESMYTGNNKAEYFNFGEDSTVEAVPNAIHTLDDSELDLTYVKKLANEKDDKGKLKQTAEAKAARLMLKDPSQRKLMRVGDMMASTGFENMQIKNPELMKVYNSKKGTGGAKSSFGDVQYLNEVLKPRSFSRKSAYAVSGVRIQSFSDYVPRMVFDYVQVIADLAAKHLPAHGYTKEPLFVKQFGLTGAKINMSLVPDVVPDGVAPGLDKDGNYIWNEEGTFPYDEAMAIQEAEGYKENCGTIAVGISDEHIKKMLADPTIQMVIPYHKSSLNPIVAAMTNVDRFENYEKVQTTKDENGNTVSKDFDWDNKLFRLSHDSKGKMLPKEEWGNVQDLVKEYADWCKAKSYTPKFPQFLYLEDGSINPGYYKLLEDFALLDNDGNFKPQGDVQMRFPTEDSAFGSMKDLIAQGLSEDTELEAKRSSEISGIVDEIEGMFDQGTLTEQSATSEKLAARMSISADLDEPYMDAYFDGDDDAMQELVDEAAERAGYTYKAYHHTEHAFTVFDLSKARRSMDIQGFYFSSDPEAEREYGSVRYDVYLKIENPYIVDSSEAMKALPFDFGTEDAGVRARDWLKENGYDAVIRDASFYGAEADEIIVLDPEQIKSSEPMLFEDDPNGEYGEGEVIPLSERFDPTNNDIRYSMSTEDADGNVLTTNQMEFFRNSQARDENGRLVPVYHSTYNGGFTIFDPSYSADSRSLFFTNYRTMSESYISEAETGDINPYEEQRKYRTIIDVNELPDGYDPNNIFGIEVRGKTDIYEGDDYLEAAKALARYAEADGWDLSDFSINVDEIYNDGPKAAAEAWNLFAASWDFDVEYQMSFSEDIAEGDELAGTYTCYLNLENPLIVDAKGERWHQVPYGGELKQVRNLRLDMEPEFQETDEYLSVISGYTLEVSWEQLGDSDEWSDESFEIKLKSPDLSDPYWFPSDDEIEAIARQNGISYSTLNDMLVEAEENPMDGSLSYESEDEQELSIFSSTYNTRQLAEIAQSEGHDGVIIRNVVDYGHAGYGNVPADVYIAFSSNQVKDTRNENPTENPDIRYSVTEDEAMTYAAENAKTTDDLWYTDPEMESDRVRVANSKMAYIESRITKWNERWLTEGQVLDEKSVKSNIRNLIRGVMANSDTDYQYKTEMVDNAVKAAKKAFYLRKVGKYSEAADLLFDTAQEIYQDNKFYGEDADFQGYKELRDFIRKTKFYVPEDQWRDIDMEAFRRNNFGSILLGSDGVAVDTIWEHMNSRWPEWFSMEVTHPADMMLSIEYALEKAKPIAHAYASEEAMSLAAELADDLDTIISEGKEYVSIADTYKRKYDDKTKQMKQRHNEAMRKYRENLQDKYKKRFSEWKKDYKEKQKNKADHRKLFEGIKDDYDWLSKAVLDPTKTKYIPEAFRASLAQLLMQMDLETARSKQLEKKYGRVTSNTLKLRELRDRLNDLATAKAGDDSNLFDIDSYLPYLMDALAEKYDGQPISAMDVDSLKTMKILFKALRKNFTNLNRETEESKANVATKKATQIVLESNARIDRDGMAKKYEGLRDYMQTINMTSLTPPYFFERMGTVNDLYKELRGGFDTYVRNEAYIMDRLRGILSSYYNKPKGRHPRPGSELEAWRDSRTAKTLELTNGTITMTAAQRMSLYCLTNRKQAMDHMLAGGIVVTPYEAASKIEAAKQGIKGKTEFGERLILSHADTELIKASLTPEQIKMANELQKLMSEDMARLGNEAHREMYGYEIFGEPNYFPIKSKDTWVPKDVNNMTDAVEKIKSFGPSKPLVVNASNAIVVDDIFSVVADHCNGMNLYNAYLVPISNFMRVYNTTVTLEDGSRRPVRDALEQAYGKKAMQYIDNFIRDLNGIKDRNRGGLEDIMNKAIGTAKATAVAGNLRVAAQQPTAYVRAAAEMDWKYLAPFVYVRPEKGVMDEMFEYCPIARWKSWGYYDTYMGRDIEDVMMNNWSIRDEVLSGVYGKLDNMTWAGIWQAVKAEQKDKHPEMDHESREFLEICGARASEIFDKTQVVDSTFHRSDAMRNKQVAVKLFTAFMSEPTLTLNVLRAAVYNYQELMKAGHKGAARKVLGKAISVLLVQAAFVSVAQALADAWRGKEPGFPWDDDDEEGESTYFSRFLQNLFHNFIEQLHLENNLYLVKDVKPYADFMMSKATEYAGVNPFIRTLMGWDQEYLYNQNNLVFAGLENTATGVSQLFKKLEKGEDYDKTKYEIIQKIASGIGTFTGLPVGTLMRDFKPIFDKLFTAVNAADTLELPSTTKTESDGASEKTEDSGEKKSIFGFHIKSAEEKAADKEEEEINKKIQDIQSKTEGLSQEEKNQKIYSMVTRYMKDHQDGKPMADYIAAGDYWSIGDIGNMYIRAGGDGEYFKEKVFRASKSAMKKTISADNNESQKAAQARIKDYLLTNGMTEQELSDIAYKSYTKKDLQVAFRINDEDAIITEMRALMEAGMTREDIYKAYDNRNRVDLVKYKDAGGKYADKLKSMGTYIWPCNGTITSHFGHRHSPGNGVGSTNHQGLDIGASMGAPVTAADGGTVVMAKWYSGYGKTVQIQHDDGTITQYSHLSWWEPKVGDVVAQGQEIGKVGSTGNSTGPHLHFGVMKDGHYVDPEDYLNGKS